MLNYLMVLFPFALVLLMVGTRFWRETIIAMLIWLLFEGAARKWIMPSAQAPLLLVKDAGFAAAYLGYMLAPKFDVPEEDKAKLLAILTGALTIYCVIEVLNPALPTVLMAIYGLKNYLMYIPLAFILPQMIRTRKDVNKTIFWIWLFTIPLCLLALYQFSQPGDSWINRYVSHEEGTQAVASLFGEQGEGAFRYGRARTASTFSFIGGFTTYLLLAIPMLGSLLLGSHDRSRQTVYVAGALALAVGATFTTGSRTPVFILAAAFPIMMIVAGGKGLLPLGAAMRLAATTMLAGAVSYGLFSDAATAFLYRAENSDNALNRFSTPFNETVGAFQTSPLFGLGVGSNSNAAVTLGGADQYWLQGNYFELEPARVMQDLGLPGFALVYVIKIYVILMVLRYLLWSRSKFFISLQMAILVFVVPHLVLFTINNPTGGVIYWALVGFSIAIHRLERRERAEAAAAQLMAAQMTAQPPPQSEPPRPGAAIA